MKKRLLFGALALLLAARPLCRLAKVPDEKEDTAVLVCKLGAAVLCLLGLIFNLDWI